MRRHSAMLARPIFPDRRGVRRGCRSALRRRHTDRGSVDHLPRAEARRPSGPRRPPAASKKRSSTMPTGFSELRSVEPFSQHSDILGVVATAWGCGGALSALLQMRRMLKTGSSADVSLAFLCIYSGGYVAWLLYGLSVMDWPLIIADTVGITTASITITVAVVLRRRARREQAELVADIERDRRHQGARSHVADAPRVRRGPSGTSFSIGRRGRGRLAATARANRRTAGLRVARGKTPTATARKPTQAAGRRCGRAGRSAPGAASRHIGAAPHSSLRLSHEPQPARSRLRHPARSYPAPQCRYRRAHRSRAAEGARAAQVDGNERSRQDHRRRSRGA